MVYRQDAIDALRDEFKRTPTNAIRAMDTLKGLPSAKPEIIRCKDCKWNRAENCKETTHWLPCRAIVTPSEFSCIYAERREDGKD